MPYMMQENPVRAMQRRGAQELHSPTERRPRRLWPELAGSCGGYRTTWTRERGVDTQTG
jgi:hypothetical protein